MKLPPYLAERCEVYVRTIEEFLKSSSPAQREMLTFLALTCKILNIRTLIEHGKLARAADRGQWGDHLNLFA
jgi:hypothetical protein